MKYLFSILILAALLSFRFVDDIYSLSLKTMEGKKIDLREFSGKKMLFIILPLSEQDTSMKAAELQALQSKYATSLVVIGIPAQENGYSKEKDKELKRMYKTDHPGFLLAEGMKVKKSSAVEQSPIFQWLTDRVKNQHFDMDVHGVGHKFFVDERGELYAVLDPKIPLSHHAIEKILSRPVSDGERK